MMVVILLLMLTGGYGAAPHAAEIGGLREEAVQFESAGVTLHGTILLPDEAFALGRRSAIALVHGAGPQTRADQRDEAEAFAREGIVTLIYDKRSDGYSHFERSYALLAADALAAAAVLRAHPAVNPNAVGLWGLSEGAWVVPIAASWPSGREAIDFIILVAATGVPPAQQHAWNLENNLRHQGVTGSMLEAIAFTGTRLLVGAELFSEAKHDPVAPLERVSQPVLALWGALDRIQPPAESAAIVRQALERGGNDAYVMQVFPAADHGLRSSPDGFSAGGALAPGYAQTVAAWVSEVARGEAPGPSVIGPAPQQARTSRPLPPLTWWESAWLQLGALVVPALAFSLHLAMALTSRMRRLPPRAPTRWFAHSLALAGLASLLSFVGYFSFLTFTAARAVGPIIAGRSVPWLVLQALAVTACIAAILLATSRRAWLRRSGVADRLRMHILLAGGLVFVLWAAYWGLLSP